jgi:hypothetical protein
MNVMEAVMAVEARFNSPDSTPSLWLERMHYYA